MAPSGFQDGRRIARKTGIALVLTIALLAPLPPAPAQEDQTCPDYEYIQGLGDVCDRGQLYEVFAPGPGRSLGFTHGLDPVPEGAEPAAPSSPADGGPKTPAGPRAPNCVAGSAGDYYTRVFYARASNDVDNYAGLVGTIRSLVEQANGLVYDAAVATGGGADLKILCSGGVIVVTNVVLPTPMASASFSTIVTDMENLGYTDGKVKHWVYYDDTGACSCGGTGHVYNDDSLAATNWNNGNGAALFAVNFGYNSVRIMLHELGHNLGAVQNSAPHSTGALHCYDGLDTMCYNDGGPNGHLYSTGFCGTEIFDCGKDDYFNLNPAGGSYLATHWNLGSTLNRFIVFSGAPPPPPANDPFAGSFVATGTNTQSTVSATTEAGESLPCGNTATVWYRYTPSASGTLTLDTFGSNYDTILAVFTGSSVSALTQWGCNDDSGGLQSQLSLGVTAGVTYRIQVGGFSGATGSLVLHTSFTPASDQSPPTVTLLDPVGPNVYKGCVKVGATSIRAIFVDQGCVRVTVADPESGLSLVDVYYQGILVKSWFNTAGTLQHIWDIAPGPPVTGAEVRVVATNGAGLQRTVTTLVNHVG